MNIRSLLRQTQRARGFTLIEILMAVAILAVAAVLVLGSMQGSVRMQDSSRKISDANLAAVTTMRRMVSELNMAFYVSSVSEDVAENREIRYRTIFDGKREEITFTTMAYQQRFSDEAGGDQAAISYRIERRRDRKGQNRSVLIRREEAPIDDRPERGGRITEVLENVKRIRFEYWDPEREIGDDAWVNQWDVSKQQDEQLPSRVRIQLEVEHPTKPRNSLHYQMEAQLQLQDPLLLLPADVAKRLAQERRQQDDAVRDVGGNPQQANPGRDSVRDEVRRAAGRR